MFQKFRFLFLIGAITAASIVSANAEDRQYNANDIVSFFEQQKIVLNSRGICVGTDAECTAADLKDHSSAFNLLVNFDQNSASLTTDAKENLIEFSVALQKPQLASLRFAIDGFTDASGDENRNLDLSKLRAASVASFLHSMGVDNAMLEPRGWGESNFMNPDPMDASNRRVEARLVKVN